MKVFFEGGLDTIFNNKKLELSEEIIKSNSIHKIKDLIAYLNLNYHKSRNTLFKNGKDLAPGNLCVINDRDWELLGSIEADICLADSIYFISMLHGG